MTLDDADEQHRLPLHHRDPFDRLLVAQAKTNGLVVVGIDQAFDLYGVPRTTCARRRSRTHRRSGYRECRNAMFGLPSQQVSPGHR